ncbi:MAG TPA: alpha/beta hydrolase domain-containing protein [Gemmatimonadota bacterium]|nr:alpha/beta hydrolase domain-containing protein [Gemmatimonadota bacterium]
MRSRAVLPLLFALIIAPSLSSAKVVRVEIEKRELILDGRPFGAAGPYEKIVGVIYFEFDPDNPYNARIVDLKLAPRNADGRVSARANFMVLRPVNAVPGGVALLEVSNRGGMASLRYFNQASGGGFDPTEVEHFGDGLLMRMGLTVIWVGWQWDVPLQEGRFRLQVPTAVGANGEPIVGVVRADWTVDQATTTLDLAHRSHIAYPVHEPDGPRVVLTFRDGRLAKRRIVPRHLWSFARPEGDSIVPDPTRIYMETGFEAGMIYELVYTSSDPRIVGLGLAAIRDVMSYAKYDPSSPFSVDYGVAIGISQTGRFLRHYVYQGFNTDEEGRVALDGLMIHTAGAGRGSFNHRFAQPSRDAHRYSAFFYPTDVFPFTSRTQTDWQTGRKDGLFDHAFNEGDIPKIFYTNTGYEYWGRAAALIHTSIDGRSDIELYPNERIYHLASGQHFVGRYPPPDRSLMPSSSGYRGNPLDFLVTMRALLVRMVEWVRDDKAPPASAYPKIADGLLVPVDQVRFPELPGVAFPGSAHEAYRVSYGPRWWSEGIIDMEPPALGVPFPTRVPQVDEMGNELGGLRAVEILAPLATYAPWNLRVGYPGGADELTDFLGTYIPLAKTEADRQAAGDPRPSIEALYSSKEAYMEAVGRAARSLVEQRVLLEEDFEAVVRRAADHWDWVLEH